jgi:hypothetical protein
MFFPEAQFYSLEFCAVLFRRFPMMRADPRSGLRFSLHAHCGLLFSQIVVRALFSLMFHRPAVLATHTHNTTLNVHTHHALDASHSCFAPTYRIMSTEFRRAAVFLCCSSVEYKGEQWSQYVYMTVQIAKLKLFA